MESEAILAISHAIEDIAGEIRRGESAAHGAIAQLVQARGAIR